MKHQLTLTLLLLGLFSGAATIKASSSGGSGKTRNTTTNVTSTIYDTDTLNSPLLFRSDDYNGGSGEATYTAVNNVESFLSSSGVWYLNLYSQKTGTRMAYITPDDPVGSEPTAPPAGFYWKNVEITSKCTDSNGNIVPFPNLVSGSNNCDFMVDFNYNGTVYKLLLGRVMNSGDPTPGKASVACNLVNSSGSCVNWTITAGNGTTPIVANLYREASPWVFIGQYYNSARVRVTNP